MLKKIDLTMLKYVIENKCSDGPLQHAIEVYTKEYSHDITVCEIGLSFTIISFFVHLFFMIFMTPIRNHCCFSKCKTKSKLETKLEDATSSLKMKYGAYIAARRTTLMISE